MLTPREALATPQVDAVFSTMGRCRCRLGLPYVEVRKPLPDLISTTFSLFMAVGRADKAVTHRAVCGSRLKP